MVNFYASDTPAKPTQGAALHHRVLNLLLCLPFCLCLAVGCEQSKSDADAHLPADAEHDPFKKLPSDRPANAEDESKQADPSPRRPSPPIVAAARNQIGKTTSYDGSYVGLTYPGGDVPIERGVCTDVVIRALRDAHNIDLQKLVHEDMKSAFSAYPTIWGLSRPDRNIDHRRVPNLERYFERKGYERDLSNPQREYLPGDLVTCMVGNRPHIMIVSDRKTAAGVPLVIHNIGRGTQEEDRLNDFKITGHYRINPPPATDTDP